LSVDSGVVFISLAEIDGYEVKLASNKVVLSQLIAFLGCLRYSGFYHASAMGGILNLSFRYVYSTHEM